MSKNIVAFPSKDNSHITWMIYFPCNWRIIHKQLSRVWNNQLAFQLNSFLSHAHQNLVKEKPITPHVSVVCKYCLKNVLETIIRCEILGLHSSVLYQKFWNNFQKQVHPFPKGLGSKLNLQKTLIKIVGCRLNLVCWLVSTWWHISPLCTFQFGLRASGVLVYQWDKF